MLNGDHLSRPEQLPQIFDNQIQGRHQQQGDEGRKQDAEAQGDSHGDQEAGLALGFENHRCQAPFILFPNINFLKFYLVMLLFWQVIVVYQPPFMDDE